MTPDPQLRIYAHNDEQWEKYCAWIKYGSKRLAAQNTQWSDSAISRAKVAIERNAAQHGYSPDHDMTHSVPHGFHAKGISTLYDLQTGQPRLQWVKSSADQEAREAAAQEALEAMCEDIPRAKPVKAPKQTTDDLASLYVITDYHHGMRAWSRETKQDDWDLDISENLLVKAFSRMMAMSPDSKVGFVCQLGDFLHTDFPAFVAATQSGHILDADGRAEKVIETAVKVLRQVVDMALTKHETVHVLMAEGNHDLVGSVWLRTMFDALYEKEPRVTVEKSPLPYYAYQHGETALFFHHGHLRKMPQLPGVFAAQFSKIWGDTKYRYAHIGHYHHKIEKEDMGCTVTQHRTLAAKDSYAARGGYFAERKAESLTYHKQYGLVASTHVTPEMAE
jgi:hypothetical protein